MFRSKIEFWGLWLLFPRLGAIFHRCQPESVRWMLPPGGLVNASLILQHGQSARRSTQRHLPLQWHHIASGAVVNAHPERSKKYRRAVALPKNQRTQPAILQDAHHRANAAALLFENLRGALCPQTQQHPKRPKGSAQASCPSNRQNYQLYSHKCQSFGHNHRRIQCNEPFVPFQPPSWTWEPNSFVSSPGPEF